MSQQKLFSSIPEHGVKDMVRWFLFVLRTRPKLLHGLQVGAKIQCKNDRKDILSIDSLSLSLSSTPVDSSCGLLYQSAGETGPLTRPRCPEPDHLPPAGLCW